MIVVWRIYVEAIDVGFTTAWALDGLVVLVGGERRECNVVINELSKVRQQVRVLVGVERVVARVHMQSYATRIGQ